MTTAFRLFKGLHYIIDKDTQTNKPSENWWYRDDEVKPYKRRIEK